MAHRICPWWLGYWLACPLRRYSLNPLRTLDPYVHEGMTVFEPGPGMGFFTLDLARLVGSGGRVVAVDIQPKMIERLKRRADKAGLLSRIDARVASADSGQLDDLRGRVDFTLAFAMVHELPDIPHFFSTLAAISRGHASVLMAEPKGHVKPAEFDAELQAATDAGFSVVQRPVISRSPAVLLRRINGHVG